MHAHAHDVSFKSAGPGLEPWSAPWESSDIAIMLTAGPQVEILKRGKVLGHRNLLGYAGQVTSSSSVLPGSCTREGVRP